MGVFATKDQVVGRSKKRLLLIKESETSRVEEFSPFLYIGRCKSLGSLKSFFAMRLRYLGPVSCACSSSSPQGAPSGRLQQLTARWQASCYYCQLQKKKKNAIEKLSVSFYSVGMLGLKPGRRCLRRPWESWFQGDEEGPGYTQVGRKGQVIWILKDYC